MPLGLNKWIELLDERLATGAAGMYSCLGDYGPEMSEKVLAKAQEHISCYTVVIGTAGLAATTQRAQDIRPGTGVLVRSHDRGYGVLTAAHVLKRDTNTENGTAVALLVPSGVRTKNGKVNAIELPSRPCVMDGFDNNDETGPDIAFLPLDPNEWRILDRLGMIAYNLDKERWSDEDTALLEEMQAWSITAVQGLRNEASKIVEHHRVGTTGSLAMMLSNTWVRDVEYRNCDDYLELPLETAEYSYPTQWKSELPNLAAEEIETLHDVGVTAQVWSGTSGAGVWKFAIGSRNDGVPNGKVLAKLIGICFFADPEKGCVIAHGPKSIAKIAGLATI